MAAEGAKKENFPPRSPPGGQIFLPPRRTQIALQSASQNFRDPAPDSQPFAHLWRLGRYSLPHAGKSAGLKVQYSSSQEGLHTWARGREKGAIPL